MARRDGRGGSSRRRREYVAAWHLEPAAMERGEDRVRLALPRLDHSHIHGVEALVRAQLGAGLAQRAGDALAPSACVRAHVLGHVNRARADLPGEVGQLALGSPAADHEARPAPAELAVEVGEALEQELGARPGRVAPVQEPVVEAERRDDAVGLVERGPQRRVVADAKVAPQPHDRRFGQSSLATRTTSLAAVSIMSSAR